MYDTYRYIFIGGLVLSLVFLAVTIFIFFFLNIKDAIGDITGSNKRKAMERAKEGKPKTASKAKSKVEETGSASQMTSRMSIQDRYDAMEDSQHTTTLNLEKKNRTKRTAKISKPMPVAQQAPQPKQENVAKLQSPNFYKPIKINDADFIIEEDITFVHSSEVIA